MKRLVLFAAIIPLLLLSACYYPQYSIRETYAEYEDPVYCPPNPEPPPPSYEPIAPIAPPTQPAPDPTPDTTKRRTETADKPKDYKADNSIESSERPSSGSTTTERNSGQRSNPENAKRNR